MTLEVRIEMGDAMKALKGLRADVPRILADCCEELGEATFTTSQDLCPVRKGTLKKSGYRKAYGKGAFIVGYAAPYAAFVEYGTTKMRPRAYLRGAWGIVRGKAHKLTKAVIERHLARMER